MSRQIHFFAVGADLHPVLRAVEAKQDIHYVLAESGDTPLVRDFASGCDLPDLGHATHQNAICGRSYLVAHRDRAVEAREVTSNDGTIWYAVDQLVNPDTVEFTPGGVWDDEVVLYGRVATVSDTERAGRLLRAFRAAIKRHFTRVRAYWVGPEALALLENGNRLTGGAQSPREYDLSRETDDA